MKLYFQRKKDETFTSYKRDEAYLETHMGNHIKWMHSDRGGKFLSNKMKSHQDGKGTIHKLTIHNSPQQNGVVERGNRTRTEQA